MLGKISKNLRIIIIVVGALLVLFKATEDEEEKEESHGSKSGFHAEEFDDIW